MESKDTSNHPFSLEATVIKMSQQLDQFIEKYSDDQVRLERELGRRPTRSELLSWLGGAGVLSGIFFAIVAR